MSIPVEGRWEDDQPHGFPLVKLENRMPQVKTRFPMKKSTFSFWKVQISSLFVVLLLFVSSGFLTVNSALAEPSLPTPIVASLFSFSGTRPNNLGIHDGKFATCPTSPNCVSSFSEDTLHQIEPLAYSDSPEEAFKQLTNILELMDNVKIITSESDYIYAEFTSSLMGFVDDVEFYLDQPNQVIQVRSASRLGDSDLGVNRKRIEMIRELLNS